MGRERALALEPSTDLTRIQAALSETRQGRRALGEAGPPPWEVIPDVRATLERARTAGAVVEGRELVALIPLLEAAGRLAGYGRSIAPVAPELGRPSAASPRWGPCAISSAARWTRTAPSGTRPAPSCAGCGGGCGSCGGR